MRVLVLLLVCLTAAPVASAQRVLNEQDREVLETRIEALEREITIQRETAHQTRESRRAETDAEVESLRSDIDSRVLIVQVLLGTLLALTTVVGVALTFIGRPWITRKIESTADASVTGHLTAERIRGLVEAQSQPLIDDLGEDIERRTAALSAKLDSIAARIETSAEKRLQAITDNWDEFARQAISSRATTGERADDRSEALGRTLDSIKPDRANWGWADWVIHGNRLYNEARHGEALDAYNRAIAIDPTNAVAHSNRGDTLNLLGRHDDALDALDRALDIDPTDAFAHSNRGNTLNHLGRYDDALDALDRALDIGPAHAAMHYHRVRAHVLLAHYEEASDDARAALRLCDGLPDEAYRSSVALYVAAVTRHLRGEDASGERSALVEHLREPFPQHLEWAVFDEPLAEDAEVQAAIDELSGLLRAHDEAHWPGAKGEGDGEPAP